MGRSVWLWAGIVLAVALILSARRGGNPRDDGGYKSLLSQTFHFLSRPHNGEIPRQPFSGPSAWRRSTLDDDEWRYYVTEQDIMEMQAGVAAAVATGKPLGSLSADDCPMGSFGKRLSGEWSDALRQGGRGFQVIKGVPLDAWTDEEVKVFFWACVGWKIGTPGAQNNAGDLIGDILDVGGNPQTDRLYTTRARADLHVDGADVVALLALRQAKSGGLSRVVSSVTVFNELLARRPDLVPLLFEEHAYDTRGDGGISYIYLPLSRYHNGTLSTFYNSPYLRSVYELDDPPPRSPKTMELLDVWEGIAAEDEFHIDMHLERGDLQLVSNHGMVHARTDYEDYDDPALKRHLLRLWVSFDTELDWHARYLKTCSRLQIARTFVAAKMRALGKRILG